MAHKLENSTTSNLRLADVRLADVKPLRGRPNQKRNERKILFAIFCAVLGA